MIGPFCGTTKPVNESFTAEGGNTSDPEIQDRAAVLDKQAIADHVLLLHRLAEGIKGDLVVTAVQANGGVINRRFAVGDVTGMTQAAIELAGREGMSVHVSGYVTTSGGPGRGTAEDLVAVLLLAVDQDADKDRSGELPLPPAMLVRTSSAPAVNRHAYYIFDPADRPSVADATALGKALRGVSGADSATGDVARVWRCPGTLNWPNDKKLERGRPAAPQACFVEQVFQGYTDWKALRDALGACPAKPANDPDRRVPLPASLLQLLEATDKDGDRSPVAFAAILGLVRNGRSDDEIVRLMREHPAGARYADRPEKVLRADIKRARKKAARSKGSDEGELPYNRYAAARKAIPMLGIRCALDKFRNKLSVTGEVLGQWQGPLTDDVVRVVRDAILKKFGKDCGPAETHEALRQAGLDNAFDPMLDYFDKLVWDGERRLDGLLHRYFGAEDTPLNQTIGRILLVAAVRRVRSPGAKFDTIVVLEGPQGSGKSTALRVLAGIEYFCDQDLIGMAAKEVIELTEGALICELSEMTGLNKAEVTKIKSFASRQSDKARAAYDRIAKSVPRRFILVGTTNDETYLRDNTGNRRFLPVRTQAIDLKGLAADRDQLWAEAATLEAQGVSIVLPEDLWMAAAEQQDARMEVDPWDEILAKYVETSDRSDEFLGKHVFTTSKLAEEALKLQPKDVHSGMYKRIAACMRRLGFEGPKPIRYLGKVVKGYRRPEDDFPTEAPKREAAECAGPLL